MLIPRIFGTVLRAMSVICLISASMTAGFAQKVTGTDQDPGIREGSTLGAGASNTHSVVRTPFSAEDALRTVGKPGFTMTAQEAYRTVGGDTSQPAVGPKTAAALAAVAALNPPPPTADTSTSMYRAGNEQAAQAEKARINEIENQGVLDTLANLHGRSVSFNVSLLVFGLPFVFVAIYLTYRRLVVRPQVPVDGGANTSESVFANNAIASKVLSQDEVHYVQSFANELGKMSGLQGFARFIESSAGIMSIALGLIHKEKPIMLGTVVVVSDGTEKSCSVRDFQNRPMSGLDFYPTVYSALTTTRPSFEKLAQLTAKHVRPNLLRRLFG